MAAITQAFVQLSPREQRIIALGSVAALVIVGYFFGVEPLNKKAAQQQQAAETRLKQLSEMQRMGGALQTQQSRATQTAESILGNRVAGETLENGQRVIKTRPLAANEAKQLLRQLLPLGKVALHPSQQSIEVWFWPK